MALDCCQSVASKRTGNTTRSLMVFLLIMVAVDSAPLDSWTSCSECPAGSGVSRLCTKKNRNTLTVGDLSRSLNNNKTDEEDAGLDTECQPCVNGQSFSDSASRHLGCRACRTCPPNSRVKRECNATHDTECECLPDFYQDYQQPQPQQQTVTNETEEEETPHARHKHGAAAAGVVTVMSCKACDLCPHGYGAARACSSTHNTICRKCPTSAYSSVLSSTQGCSVCTVCRDDQVTINECTPFMDAVCADKDMGHPSRRIITKPLDPVVQHQEDEEYNNEGIISVYCAILGAIVLGLLIYVVMKQWRLRKAANKLAHFDPRGHHGSSATVPLNGTANGHQPNHHEYHHKHQPNGHKFECDISPSGSRRLQQNGSEGSRGSRGSDSEFNGVAAPGSDGYGRELKPITPETRLREICTAKRREMESMLNGRRDHHDWKALARDLGYTSTRIASFEQRAMEKQTGPTRHLFGDWAKREDSTVQNLVSSLCNIGRHDVTLLLVPFIQEPSSSRSATTLPRTTTTRSYKPISVV